jgi:hypothetical protein
MEHILEPKRVLSRSPEQTLPGVLQSFKLRYKYPRKEEKLKHFWLTELSVIPNLE